MLRVSDIDDYLHQLHHVSSDTRMHYNYPMTYIYETKHPVREMVVRIKRSKQVWSTEVKDI